MKRLGSLLVLVLLSLGLLGVSSAADVPLAGNPDPSFGARGIVTHGLGSGEAPGISGIALQSDGKIVVAGGSTPGDHGLLLARYLSNGSPDPSFGAGGYVETPFTYWAFAHAVALQPDGKIVVAGSSYQGNGSNYLVGFTLARYNPDGSLDTSFGTDGITNTVIPQGMSSDASATALAILPGGEILAAGGAGLESTDPNSSFALAEYRPDGSLDPTFGIGGIVQTSFTGDDGVAGIAIQPDGKIVATGAGLGMGHGQEVDTMVLARYRPDGSLDPTFGTAGKVMTNPKRAYDGGPPTLQHGKIVVAGFTRLNSGSNDFPVLARYQASGRLDTTFGKHGFVKIEAVSGDATLQGIPNAVVAQTDGKILIAAANSVVRLRPNGRLDPSFGRGGIVSLPGAVSVALAVQGDGKILVGGGSGNAWTLARLIGGHNCVVPGVDGKTVAKATTTLSKAYCRRGHIAKRFSNKVTHGRVISTTPRHGTRLPGGTKVDLVVSKGKRP